MIKGCGAAQFSDQMFCAKCGACWDVNDEDPPACKAEAVEWLTFYAPTTLLAVVAAGLVSPVLAVVVAWGLGVFGFADLAERAGR